MGLFEALRRATLRLAVRLARPTSAGLRPPKQPRDAACVQECMLCSLRFTLLGVRFQVPSVSPILVLGAARPASRRPGRVGLLFRNRGPRINKKARGPAAH